MEEFLKYVLAQLVEYPADVVITKQEEEGKVTFFLAMRQTDIRTVVGKGGHTIQALRTLLRTSGQKNGLRVGLEILEE
ncbi:MAG: KH domain-containing protein [Chthoniobacterales bacterium]